METQQDEKTLVKSIVPSALAHAATAVVESLKINSISEEACRGRKVVVKRRNGHSAQLAEMANLYFRWSDIPIRFRARPDDWRRWEIGCFRLLNGDRFRAFACDSSTVRLDKVPGNSLWNHMERGTLTCSMLEAAAEELRRAHRFFSPEFNGPWSHGDATTPNFIYNEETGRARLIDFEIVHLKTLPAIFRHADDLLVFLLDMVGMVEDEQWLPFALAFLNAYGDAEVIAELRRRIVVPTGLASIWWGVRTNFAGATKVTARLGRLRHALRSFQLRRPARSAAATRQARRASSICQVTKAGMPRPISRARATSERASAPSPGMPSRLPTSR